MHVSEYKVSMNVPQKRKEIQCFSWFVVFVAYMMGGKVAILVGLVWVASLPTEVLSPSKLNLHSCCTVLLGAPSYEAGSLSHWGRSRNLSSICSFSQSCGSTSASHGGSGAAAWSGSAVSSQRPDIIGKTRGNIQVTGTTVQEIEEKKERGETQE